MLTLFCCTGFSSGYIYWDDEDTRNANKYSGALPDGSFYGRNTRISTTAAARMDMQPIPFLSPHQLPLRPVEVQYQPSLSVCQGNEVEKRVFFIGTVKIQTPITKPVVPFLSRLLAKISELITVITTDRLNAQVIEGSLSGIQ